MTADDQRTYQLLMAYGLGVTITAIAEAFSWPPSRARAAVLDLADRDIAYRVGDRWRLC